MLLLLSITICCFDCQIYISPSIFWMSEFEVMHMPPGSWITGLQISHRLGNFTNRKYYMHFQRAYLGLTMSCSKAQMSMVCTFVMWISLQSSNWHRFSPADFSWLAQHPPWSWIIVVCVLFPMQIYI